MSDEYRTVTFILQQLRVDSVMLTRPHPKPHSGDVWLPCPRSCIHGGDDLKLSRHQHDLPKEVTVRMWAWKADELRLA